MKRREIKVIELGPERVVLELVGEVGRFPTAFNSFPTGDPDRTLFVRQVGSDSLSAIEGDVRAWIDALCVPHIRDARLKLGTKIRVKPAHVKVRQR